MSAFFVSRANRPAELCAPKLTNAVKLAGSLFTIEKKIPAVQVILQPEHPFCQGCLYMDSSDLLNGPPSTPIPFC
jgi:hypothetical protein